MTIDRDQLIATVERLAAAGRSTAARSVLRALVAQFPSDPQVRALRRRLDPPATHVLSQPSLPARRPGMPPFEDRLRALEVRRQPVAAPNRYWRTRRIVLVALALLMLVLLIVWRWWPVPATSSPPASAATAASTSLAALPTSLPPATPQASRPPLLPTTTPTTVPLPTATSLPAGTVLTYQDWQISLQRPQFAGELPLAPAQPTGRGRLIVVLVSVANLRETARQFPASLVWLRDSQGRVYPPVPDASSAYLTTFQRGQVGEVALEEPIPGGGGLVGMPLIFEVAPGARGLRLHVADAGSWAILEDA